MILLRKKIPRLAAAAALGLTLPIAVSAGPIERIPGNAPFTGAPSVPGASAAGQFGALVLEASNLSAPTPTGATPGADNVISFLTGQLTAPALETRLAAAQILRSLRDPAVLSQKTNELRAAASVADGGPRRAAEGLETLARKVPASVWIAATANVAAVLVDPKRFDGRVGAGGGDASVVEPAFQTSNPAAKLNPAQPRGPDTSLEPLKKIERLEPDQVAADRAAKTRKAVFAGMVGNVIEWYDFGLYGYLGVTIGNLFFPAGGVLAVFSVFAAGFLMRPLGAIVFGRLGDRLGRKRALTLSVVLMVVPTILIGFLPTYAAIGVMAPILLTGIRLLQGLSAGGEFTGSVTYMVEHAQPTKRGLTASWTPFSVIGGMLLGSVAATAMALLPGASLLAWGWRVPFLFASLLGLIGWRLRSKMEESPLFESLNKTAPVKKPSWRDGFAAIRRNAKGILLAGGINTVGTGAFYTLFLYMATYLHSVLHLSAQMAFGLNSIGLALLIGLIPVMGRVSDKIGRKPVLAFGAAGLALFTFPLFLLLGHATILAVLGAQGLFSVFTSALIGVLPATMVELFPTRDRATGLALSHNLSVTLFGGTAPIIAAALVATHGMLSPAFYLIALAAISLIALWRLPEGFRKQLK